MKNLLGVLSSVIIGTAVSGLAAPSVQAVNNDSYSSNFSGNSSGKKEVINVDDGYEKRVGYTFNLGSNKSFSSMSFNGSSGFRFSGGESGYGPGTMGSRGVSLDSSTEAKITDGNFINYLQYILFNEKVGSGLANMHGYVSVGYAGYQEGGDYYFQFLVYQSLQSSNSFTGGSSGFDLGTELVLS